MLFMEGGGVVDCAWLFMEKLALHPVNHFETFSGYSSLLSVIRGR